MHTFPMHLTLDQIVEETREWPEDVVADLVDRILRAKYRDVAPSVDAAWHDEIQQRVNDIRSGEVQGVPGEEVSARIRKIVGR